MVVSVSVEPAMLASLVSVLVRLDSVKLILAVTQLGLELQSVSVVVP